MRFFSLFLIILLTHSASANNTLDDLAKLFQLQTAKTLEWQQNNQSLIASGDVHLTYQDFTINANQARLIYAKPESGDAQKISTNDATSAIKNIISVDLTGLVKLKNSTNDIKCDNATYNFADSKIILTGKEINITNVNGDKLLVNGKITINLDAHNLLVDGEIQINRQNYQLNGTNATMMFLPFAISDFNKIQLDNAILHKNVTLKYPDLTVTADNGVYTQSDQLVTLNKNVIITRQNSIINTNQAVINLTNKRIKLNSPSNPITGNIHVPDFTDKQRKNNAATNSN